MMTEREWLKGSHRIVLDAVDKMLSEGDRVSVRRVADRVPYSEVTVLRALRALRCLGYLSMEQPRSGCRADGDPPLGGAGGAGAGGRRDRRAGGRRTAGQDGARGLG